MTEPFPCPHHKVVVDDLDMLPPTSGVYVDGWMAGTVHAAWLGDDDSDDEPVFIACELYGRRLGPPDGAVFDTFAEAVAAVAATRTCLCTRANPN